MPDDEQTPPPQIAINIGQDGMLIQVPVGIPLSEELMNRIATDWLKAHPALFDQLIKQRLGEKQHELAIITDIRSKRLN